MSGSGALYSEAKKVIPSGVNSPVRYYAPYPFFAERADGSSIWDADGRQYIDLCNGYGALLLGHRRPEIIEAVRAQLEKGTLFCTPTEQETELSKLIIGNYPSIDRVRLVNTGAEATMAAVRLARGFTKASKIIKFDGCYHGAHDSVLANSGTGSRLSVPDGVPDDTARNTLVVPYNDPAELERTIQKSGDVAGVILEPVMGNMGVIPPADGFLGEARKITEQNGIPLIFDETITGFRLSPGGAQETYGIKPDITTLGKALGGGLPIAALGGRAEIMDLLAPGGRVYQASTFAGNPVSVAASLASVKTINRLGDNMYRGLERSTDRFVRALDDAATDLGIPHQINHATSMFQIFFTDAPVTDARSARSSDAEKFSRMFAALLQDGVYVAPSRFEVVLLSSAHTDQDVDRAIDAYVAALRSVK